MSETKTPLTLSLIVPTYNEARIIQSSLKAIEHDLGETLSAQTEVIVVDDGTDDLPDQVEAFRSELLYPRLEVVRNTPGVGKGKSIEIGFRKARAPLIGFLDIDLSTSPKVLHRVLEVFAKDETDIFIASRAFAHSKVEREKIWLRDLLRSAYYFVTQKAFFKGQRLYRDTQCGFKFFRREVGQELWKNLVANDGLADLEVLVRANRMGARVHEEPVIWIDTRVSSRSLRRIIAREIPCLLKLMMVYVFWPANRKTKTSREVPQSEDYKKKFRAEPGTNNRG